MIARRAAHEAPQGEVVIEVLSRGSDGAAFETFLHSLPNRETHQGFMLGGLQMDAPFRNRDISGIKRAAQDFRDSEIRHLAVAVLANGTRGCEIALHFGGALEPTRRHALESLGNYRCGRFIAHENAPATLGINVAIPRNRGEAVEAFLDPRTHFLRDLPPILFALQLALRGGDGFKKPAFRAVLEIKIQTFAGCSALRHNPAQAKVELRVAGIAFEIIKNDDVFLIGLGIEIGEQRDHAGAVHEIATATYIIRKYRLDLVALGFGIFSATMLLRIEARSLGNLSFGGNPTINDCLG